MAALLPTSRLLEFFEPTLLHNLGRLCAASIAAVNDPAQMLGSRGSDHREGLCRELDATAKV